MTITLGSPDLYTIGWIAALPIERTAAMAMLDERHDAPDGFEQHSADHNSYSWGRIGSHNIVIASLPAGVYGQNAAAVTATQLLSSLPDIRIGLLVGIGGGIPNHGPVGKKYDIRLGDVVVGQPTGTEGGVIQYDLGKMGSGEWERTGTIDKPPRVLLNALSNLQAEHGMSLSKVPKLLEEMIARYPLMANPADKSWGFVHPGIGNDRLFVSEYSHAGGDGDDPCSGCDSSKKFHRDDRHTPDPAIHYGTIASGNMLVKDASFRDGIASKAGQQCICFEMEAAGLNHHFPCIIIRGICDYSDSHKNDRWQKYASATAAAYAKELLGFIPVKSVKATPRAIEVMSLINDLNHNVQGLENIVLGQGLRQSLDKLPTVDEASFDSHDESENPVCLDNTRVELLSEVMQWAKAPDSKSVFWLRGTAGTGKSTISRSFARRLDDAGLLGASFFFKRGEADRGISQKLFTTVASQLATRIPDIATYIKQAVDSDAAVGTKSLREQFDKLILEPLSKFLSSDSTTTEPIIILIDALDECELGDSAINRAKLIISLFTRTNRLSGLRVFVTSRPELPIQIGFDAVKGTYQDIILQEIPRPQIQRDISIFLGYNLARIRGEHRGLVPEDWPSPSELDRLVNMAVPLFIVAATICRFLDDRRHGSPRAKLIEILRNSEEGWSDGLYITYMSVLSTLIQGLRGNEKERVLQQFRYIVGSIVLLATPLTTRALSRILLLRQDVIDEHLSMLHSVLNVPSNPSFPVRLLHLSFRDFLVHTNRVTNGEACPFLINERESHANIATQCLQLLSAGNNLRRDICGLKHPGAERCNISQQMIDVSLPPEIKYASQYWVYHWKESSRKIQDGDLVQQFLKTHFLHWLEALAIQAQVRDSIGMIEDLLNLLDDEKTSASISKFLHDARRVILQNCATVHDHPLQIYYTALVFAPQNSYIRNHFRHEFPVWVTKLPLVDSHWNAQLQVIKDYDIASHFVAFSLDSSLLAYVCFHGIIKLLDARTGECIASLRGHKSVVTCIIFLPDSRIGQLASASEDGTIKIWDITTEECISTLGGGNDEIESIVYLPGPRPMLAAATETSITAWNLETKKCTATLKHNHDGGGNRMSMAVIGGAGLLISSGSYDSSIKVWDMASNSCIKTLKGHTDRVNSIAVSPDSSMIASASGDGTIILWDAAERSSIATLQNHSKPVKSVDFLSASMLASASDDGAVRIWDTSRHTCLATLLMSGYDPDFVVFTYAAASHDARLLASVVGTHICIWDVAIAVSSEGATTKNPPDRQAKAYGFSQDSTVFASGSTNGNIQIWNTISGELKQTLAGQSGTIRKITIWPDSTRIASMSDNGIIRLWDTKTGKCIKTLLGHKGEGLYPQLALSPDLTTLASSLNNIVKLWDVKTVAFRKHSFLRKGYFSRYGSGKAACIATLDATYFVNGMAFSPDSDLLAIASRGITIWDWATCTRLHTIDTRLSMSSIAFLRNARVLSCDLVGDLRLWDLATGTCLSTFEFGEGFYHLDSDESGSSIRTDRGFLTFQHPLSSTLAPSEDSRSQAVQIGVGLSADKTWVTWDECKILWLPPIYRAKEWVFNTRVTGPRIVIGLSLGRPFISITVDEIALSQLKSLSPRSSLASNSDADFQDGDEEDFQDSEEEDFQDSDEEETHQA